MACQRRDQVVTAALRDELDNGATAETMLAVLRTYPPSLRPPGLASAVSSSMAETRRKLIWMDPLNRLLPYDRRSLLLARLGRLAPFVRNRRWSLNNR